MTSPMSTYRQEGEPRGGPANQDWDPLSVGRRIQAARMSQGMDQKTLAGQLNFSVPGVSRIESGKAFPSLPVFRAICLILDVDSGHLLGVPPAIRTKSGRTMSDTELDALAAEAERGYDVAELQRKVEGRVGFGAAAGGSDADVRRAIASFDPDQPDREALS